MNRIAAFVLIAVSFLYTSNAIEPAPAPTATTEFRYINGQAESVAGWNDVQAYVLGIAPGGLLVQEYVYEKRTHTVTTMPRPRRVNRMQRIGAFGATTTAGSNVMKTREETFMVRVPTTKALLLHYWANQNPRPYSPLQIKAKLLGTHESWVEHVEKNGYGQVYSRRPVKETVNVYDFGLRSPTR